MKKESIVIRIDLEMHRRAKAKADKNGQTVKGYVSKLIEKDTAGEVTQPTPTTTPTTTQPPKGQ